MFCFFIVSEEEKKYGHTSPRFDGFSDSLSDKALGVQDTSPHTAATVFNMTQRRDSSLIQDSSVNEANMTMIPTTSSQESTTNMAKQGDSMVKSEVKNEARKQILMTDLQCTLCKQLLYRPIVLNCGHGRFCDQFACHIRKSSSITLKCLLSSILQFIVKHV